jgi:hypothetical protein
MLSVYNFFYTYTYTCPSRSSDCVIFPRVPFLRSPRSFSPAGRETINVTTAAILAVRNAIDKLYAYAASAGACRSRGILESAVFE